MTNYYVEDESKPDSLGLHIGGKEVNWVFQLRVYPKLGLNTLKDWVKYLCRECILTERDTDITPIELLYLIMGIKGDLDFSKSPPRYYAKTWKETHHKNNSVEGPNGMLRTIESESCTHGEGSWDYISIEFS